MKKVLVGMLSPVVLVLLLADVAGATVIYYKPFAIAAPNKCGIGVGQGNSTDATHVFVQAETRSRTAGSNGVCDDPAPWAHAGIRVRPRLEKLYSTGWRPCAYGDQGALPAGHDVVYEVKALGWCGAGTYRVGAHHEIRYSTWQSAVLISGTL